MKTFSKRELNQRTANTLDEVTASDDVVITERGKARWRITAVTGDESVLDRLEREGRYTPPAPSPAAWPRHPGGPAYATTEADALLDELRGDH